MIALMASRAAFGVNIDVLKTAGQIQQNLLNVSA